MQILSNQKYVDANFILVEAHDTVDDLEHATV